LALSYAQQSRQFPRDGRQPFTALAFAMEAMRVDDPPADVQRALSEVLAQPGALRRYMGHSSRVWRVDFTSDGQFMVSGGNDGEVILWDTETGQEIRRYGDYKTWVFNVDISPDDKSIITSHRTPDEGSPLELVVAFDLETGEEKWRVDFGEGHTNTVFAISYSPDGKTVYSGSFEGDPTRNLIAWDAETGEELRRYTQDGHTVRIIEVDVSPDSQILGSAGFDDNTAILWDAETARQIHKFEYPGSLVQAIQFSPDGTAVAVGVSTDSDPEDEDHIYIYSLEDYSLLQTFDLPTGLRGLHYSRDGSKVAVGGWVDNSAFVFDLATGATQRFGGAGELTVSAVFTPDGQSVVSTANGVLIRWALNGESNISRRYPTEEAGEITPLQALALSPDQTSLLVGGDDGRLSLWEAASGALLRNFAASTANINALAFSPDGSQAATAGQDGSLRLWNAATGEELQNLSQQNVPLRALAYSPDGALIAAGGGNIQISADRPADNSIRFWNTATGEAGLVLEGHTAPVRALAFSPDGTRLLSASDDRSLILWDVATGAPVLTLTGHSEAVLSLDFSADGTRALSGSADSSVILWDLGTGQILERLFGHTTSVQAVAFYPADERYAFSSSGEVDAAQSASLLMWDLEQGESIRAYSGHSRMAQAISFSADGQKMYTAGQDGALIAWQIYTPRALVDWVYTRYDVVCVENPAFGLDPATGLPTNDPRCVTHQLAGQAEEETPAEEAEVIAETVDQTEVEVSADNLCALDYTSLIPAGTVDAAAFQQAGPYVIGFSNSSSRGPDALIAGWARYQASQEAEVTSFILKNAEGDFNQQVQDVQDLLAEGAQALIINPIEQLDMSLLTAVLEQAMAQNVPVIIVNRRIENADYLSFVGPDDYEVGCVLAQEMAALMDGEGKYLQLSGIEGTLSDRTRKGAGLDVDAVYPSILSAQEAATSLTEEGIRAQVNSALQNAPQIDAIWAFDGFVAAVALEAFQAAGRDYPPVVGDGYLAFSKLAVGENIPAVQVRIPAQMGAQALQIALQALRGESVSQFSKVDLEIIPAGDLGEFDLNKPDDGTLGDYEGLPREYWGG
jgi:WD40 repeat protein/ABC-type sugar transport system substrate-binding protein